MTYYSNNAEGYTTSPTTVTTANSGGGSGDAYTLVTSTVAGSITAINTDHAHGSWCYSIVETTVANNAIIGRIGLSSNGIAVRFYIKFNTLPSAVTRIAAFRNASGNAASIVVLATNKLQVQQTGGGGMKSFATALSAGTWYRIEFSCAPGTTTTDGYLAAAYYALDSTTPVEAAWSSSAVSTGAGAAITEVRLGKLDAQGSADLRIDDAAVNDATTSAIGPVVSGATQATLAAAQGSGSAVEVSADAEIVVTGSAPASGSGRANPVSVGAGSTGISLLAASGSARGVAVHAGSAPLLTAVPDPTNSPPRVILTVGQAAGSTVTITRTDISGNVATVRSANPATLAAGGWVGFDYECPFGQPVVYTATTDVSATATLTATVELDVQTPWLIDPGIPSRSVPLTIHALGDTVRDTNQGIHRPLGRESAVVITDGRRQSPTFDLTVRTSGPAEESALTALLDAAQTLLLQIAYPGMTRTQYSWVSVGATTKSRLVPWWGCEDFIWSFPCTSSSRPTGLLQAQFTWPDLVATEATWASVKADYATWRDVIIATSGG